jgi:hypothetical protein
LAEFGWGGLAGRGEFPAVTGYKLVRAGEHGLRQESGDFSEPGPGRVEVGYEEGNGGGTIEPAALAVNFQAVIRGWAGGRSGEWGPVWWALGGQSLVSLSAPSRPGEGIRKTWFPDQALVGPEGKSLAESAVCIDKNQHGGSRRHTPGSATKSCTMRATA